MKKSRLLILAGFILLILIVVIMLLFPEKPGSYDSPKAFKYIDYLLELNIDGKYMMHDITCRRFTQIKQEYALYHNKLILYDGSGAELVFTIDGDSLIYNEKKSTRPEDFKVIMKDGTRWNPSTLFLYFKDE